MPNLHFRCTDEQKVEIEARAKAAGYAKLSPYLRDRALSDGSAVETDSQAKAERVAGSTGVSAPVAEQPDRDGFIERRTKALYLQGDTPNRAMTRAKQEWKDAHPDERTQ